MVMGYFDLLIKICEIFLYILVKFFELLMYIFPWRKPALNKKLEEGKLLLDLLLF
jgi:hypothetical protein